jgi:hypothetical protein
MGGAKMEEEKQVGLTSGELAFLWAQYMNDTASVCLLTYFLEKAEDSEIKSIIGTALRLSLAHIEKITIILTEEKNSIPQGFKLDEDVNLSAPRLFSDTYVLNFIHQMARIGLGGYGVSLSLSVRHDITEFNQECLTEYMGLYKNSKEILLSKGLYIRSPNIPNLDHNEFVQKQSFVLDFGEKRPLTALEIVNLYSNIQRNSLGVATLIGFSQVTKSKDVKSYFTRGIEIATKHIEKFGGKMKESNLTVPMIYGTDVTTSTQYTFSDKLMMFYTTALIGLSVGFYGASCSVSPRLDLGVLYNTLSIDIQRYAEDGANIMIKNSWLEQPPMAPDRNELANENNQ